MPCTGDTRVSRVLANLIGPSDSLIDPKKTVFGSGYRFTVVGWVHYSSP